MPSVSPIDQAPACSPILSLVSCASRLFRARSVSSAARAGCPRRLAGNRACAHHATTDGPRRRWETAVSRRATCRGAPVSPKRVEGSVIRMLEGATRASSRSGTCRGRQSSGRDPHPNDEPGRARADPVATMSGGRAAASAALVPRPRVDSVRAAWSRLAPACDYTVRVNCGDHAQIRGRG